MVAPREQAALAPATGAIDFNAVVRSLGRPLSAWARRLECSSHGADDLIQDTLERALRKRHTFRPGTNIRSWLFRIMRNRFVDGRRRRRVPTSGDEVELAGLAAPESERTQAWELIGADALAASVARLEPELRSVLELRVASLTYQEIADALEIPPSTVGTRLLRARQKLRELLASLPVPA